MNFQEALLHLKLMSPKEKLIIEFLTQRLQLNSEPWQLLFHFISLEFSQGRIRLELSESRFAKLIQDALEELESQKERMDESTYKDCLEVLNTLDWRPCLEVDFLAEVEGLCSQVQFDNELENMQKSSQPLVLLKDGSKSFLYFQKNYHSELSILNGMSNLLSGGQSLVGDSNSGEGAKFGEGEQQIATQAPQKREKTLGDIEGKPEIQAIKEVFGFPNILGRNKETQEEFLFHERQVMAAYFASLSNFFIISGGPGTGKTSVLVQVLRTLLRTHSDLEVDQIALCAPTGRAKARMGESMKGALQKLQDHQADPKIARDLTLGQAADNAYTLHSLLYKQLQGSKDKLNYKLIVVDEFSMVDVELFSLLIQSMDEDCKLILLGDMHQLPPVGQGSVLGNMSQSFTETKASLSADLLEDFRAHFSQIPMDHDQLGYDLVSQAQHRLLNKMIVLTKTHRSEGDILKLALSVNDADLPEVSAILNRTKLSTQPLKWPSEETSLVYLSEDLSSVKDSADFYLKHHLSPNWKQTLNTIQEQYWNSGLEMNKVSAASHNELYQQFSTAFQPHMNMRILCLSHHGASGTQQMNQQARKILQSSIKSDDTRIHGELVMVTRNQNDLELYNGDSGMVFVFRHQSYVVFPGEGFYRIEPIERLHYLQSAFAISVHKSQGSEYASIFMALPEYKTKLLNREILYTGLTRAKKLAFLNGDQDLFQEGVKRFVHRPSGLSDWLERLE